MWQVIPAIFLSFVIPVTSQTLRNVAALRVTSSNMVTTNTTGLALDLFLYGTVNISVPAKTLVFASSGTQSCTVNGLSQNQAKLTASVSGTHVSFGRFNSPVNGPSGQIQDSNAAAYPRMAMVCDVSNMR